MIELKTAKQESIRVENMKTRIKISVMISTTTTSILILQPQVVQNRNNSTRPSWRKKGGVINPPKTTVKSTRLPYKNLKRQTFIQSPITRHNKYDVTLQRNHVPAELR